jgi:threonine aldolase
MDFRSDNVTVAAQEIIEALASVNHGTVGSYGSDPYTAAMIRRFSDVFERPVAVIPVSTGIAANALALSVCSPPYGLIYCHPSAHVLHRESGATEFFTGGAKLVPVPGPAFKIDAATFAEMVDADRSGLTSKAPPSALSLTQATDGGTVYTPAEVEALSAVAHRFGLKVHMDGARFSNAVAGVGCSPADLSWRAGVDIMSFGATKCGAMNTDAIVVFDETMTEELRIRARRSGQATSKMRFASAQLERFVRDGLWLQLAGRANNAAKRLAGLLRGMPQVDITAPVEANELFLSLPAGMVDFLEQHGVLLYRRGPGKVRLVCRFDTEPSEIDGLYSLIREAAAGR